MPEEPQDAGTEQASPASPQAGTGTEQASPGSVDPKLASELAEARRQAAEARTQLRELQTWKAEQEAATLTETERAKKQAGELQTTLTTVQEQLRTTRLELTILRHAPTYQIAPEAYGAALKLLDAGLIEWDADNGQPTKDSIEKAMKALVRDNPFLLTQGTAPPPAQNGAPTNPPADRRRPLTRADIERMPADEINARWGEVQAVLRQP
jgi:hypothetical protein